MRSRTIAGLRTSICGKLDEAARECDAAAAIDPGNFNWRSCAFAFSRLEKTAFAKQYLNKDTGSEWSNAVMVSVLMREGRMKEARESAENDDHESHVDAGVSAGLLDKAPSEAIHRLAERAQTICCRKQDSELKYYQERYWRNAARRRSPMHFCAKQLTRSIARTRLYRRIPC